MNNLTIAFFEKCHLWIVGEKEKNHGVDVLKKPCIFSQNGSQVGIGDMPGGSPPEIELDASLAYPVTNQVVVDLYVEHTTGIKVQRAPLANPNGPVLLNPRGSLSS
jgi:hypothetical protein